MQNKIDHANRILLMDRYPNITVEELFYLIACRIEGENFVVSRNYSTGNTKKGYGGDRLG